VCRDEAADEERGDEELGGPAAITQREIVRDDRDEAPSRGLSIMRVAMTPAALQPKPIIVVMDCLPWAPAFLNR